MIASLEGLNALITGGGSGIGRCIAETFRAAGASVAVCDADPTTLEATSLPAGIAGRLCDVSDEDQTRQLFRWYEGEFGRLDILVNNAGVTGPFGPIEELAPEDWKRTIDVNVNGIFFCTRHAVPMLKSAGGGSIVNISSIAGRMGYALRTPYSTSKWGVIGLTQSLAMELGPHRIRVNALLPGFVAGPRHERNAEARAALLGITKEEQKRSIRRRISLRELTQPQDVANTATFLVSPAGAHITGQSLSVDGNVETLGSH